MWFKTFAQDSKKLIFGLELERPAIQIKAAFVNSFGAAGFVFTHCCDEAVEGLSPLRVLHCDRTEIIPEPDRWDNSSRVAVSNIFLCVGGKKKKKKRLQVRNLIPLRL